MLHLWGKYFVITHSQTQILHGDYYLDILLQNKIFWKCVDQKYLHFAFSLVVPQTPVRPQKAYGGSRKILGERNVCVTTTLPCDETFVSQADTSLASTCSYTEFQVRMSRPSPTIVFLEACLGWLHKWSIDCAKLVSPMKLLLFMGKKIVMMLWTAHGIYQVCMCTHLMCKPW